VSEGNKSREIVALHRGSDFFRGLLETEILPAGHRTLTRDEVLTAREVADLLRMPVSTVYELARRGELPASRFGKTWRFLRPRLESLLAG
jgi:excisionase family DNA binding protein